jgi:hypothetical protein
MIEPRLGFSVVFALCVLFSPLTLEAQHAKWVSIEEYYQSANPADEILPGARVGDYGLPIRDVGFGFLNGEWNHYFFDDKEGKQDELRAHLRAMDGKIIPNTQPPVPFDYRRFEQLLTKDVYAIKDVVFYELNDRAYVKLAYRDRSKKIILPIAPHVVKNIRSMWAK